MTTDGMALTERQRVEANVYDTRVRETMALIRDADLLIDRDRPPFPNREHVHFLSFALERIGELSGARVLEVGSGTGALSVYLALRGASVTGIDISEENCRLARRRAAVNGVSDRVQFIAVPIEQLEGASGSYDAIIGNQVLHHFELPVAMPNIGRLLRPGGRALFCEPVLLLPDSLRRLRDSGAVKRVAPKKVDTPTERSVSMQDVATIRRTFPGVALHPFQLLARLQNFVDLPDGIFTALERLDRWLLRVPGVSRLCRFVVFEVTGAPAPAAGSR
jgi:2-polyprenyl-3-methyl-5-hydroxy-6-metoxy-1,4-benzoquinol methylase